MNYSIIRYTIGWVLSLEAALMVPSCITALIYKESEIGAFLMTMALCLLVGIPLICRKPKKRLFMLRKGLSR